MSEIKNPEQSEKTSTISKFIGDSPEQNRKMRELLEARFKSGYLEPAEREKTEEEKKFLKDINEKMAVFIRRYGGDPIEISANLIKFIDWSKLSPDQAQLFATKFKDGFFSLDGQRIVIFKGTNPAYPNRVGLANLVGHELIHANSFQSLIVNPDTDLSSRHERIGLSIANEGPDIFQDLNEAITAELNIRFHNEFLKDIEFTVEEFRKLKKLTEDIQTRAKDPSKFSDIASVHQIPLPDKSTRVTISPFEYAQQRLQFNKIIDKINELNPDMFGDREEIFNIFARAMLTGEVKQLTELVENTFGRGTFKKLASTLDIFEDAKN
ncbi:MAG: hypothetical protein HYT62_02405 [Candidatus Yanofskybacteria bacterium]|nr:hypothetical protein [Candidatus Yanofskybacteria bacterium]